MSIPMANVLKSQDASSTTANPRITAPLRIFGDKTDAVPQRKNRVSDLCPPSQGSKATAGNQSVL